MRKLKILHVIPSLAKGGAERLTIDTCNELSERGMDVSILTFDDDIGYSHLSAKVKWQIIHTEFIPSMFRQPSRNLQAYQQFLFDLKPDILHSHLFLAEMVTRQVLIEDVAYVTHLHDNMSQFRNFSWDTLSKKRLTTNFFEKKILVKQYRKCRNNFIAISKHTADYFITCLPTDLAQRIITLNNAIDFNRFCQNKPPSLSYPVRLVTTGSLVDKKNQIFLVDVVRLLADRGLDIRLDILGDGPNRDKINNKIHESGLSQHITLSGNVENVEDFLHRSHIYVHPARYEPFGLAILEAMAAGLPCVMLDGKGNRDIADDGKNGFLLMDESAKTFAERIEEIIETPSLHSKMSLFAVAFAKKFDIKAYVSRLIEYYMGILKT